MSTFASAQLDSDDEDDLDFVPAESSKRKKLASPVLVVKESSLEREERARKAADAFESMREEAKDPPQPKPTIEAVAVSQTKPMAKRPPRKKPRQTLEEMSLALDKGKKLTTFAKSQLDWKSHTASDASLKDELDANRKSGGFLEKRDFLDRVDERRTDAFDKRKG